MVDVLILAIWHVQSPEYETAEPLEVQFQLLVNRSVCVSDTGMFATLSLLYKALLLVAGCYISYKVRRIDERIGEMKPMLLTIYNISICAILVFLFDATDQPVAYSVLIKAIAILFVVLLAQAALILGPFAQEKMQKYVEPTHLTSSTSHGTATDQDMQGNSKLSKEIAELRAQVAVLKMENQMLKTEK
jgi:hypothetical protein